MRSGSPPLRRSFSVMVAGALVAIAQPAAPSQRAHAAESRSREQVVCPACTNPTPPTTTIPTARGPASLVPTQTGPDGSYLLVHEDGTITLMTSDGERVWSRSSTSFADDWGVISSNAPSIRTGYEPREPMKPVSTSMYALGRLDGGSAEYLAVAHRSKFWVINQFGGQSMKSGTFVTVIDTSTGEVAWSEFFSGIVTQLAVVDRTLVVGHETGAPTSAPEEQGQLGEAGTTSTLSALSFSSSDAGLDARQLWSHSTGSEWGRWLAVEPAGDGRIAAALTDTEPGSGAEVYGQVLMFDAPTGALRWEVDRPTYPRFLRFDAERDELVILGQTDPRVAHSYSLQALRSDDGAARGASMERAGALPYALEIGNIDGAPGNEWVTTDLAASPLATASEPGRATATAVSGDGTQLWSASLGVDPPRVGPGRVPIEPEPFGLALVARGPESLVVAATHFSGTEPLPLKRKFYGLSELEAFSGATGTSSWRSRGEILAPLSMAPVEIDGEQGLLTATGRLVANIYSLDDGSTLVSTPLLADITAVETLDVNDDGVTDLVAGGESEAVFALDGRTLGADPDILWTRPVAGEVHEIHVVDMPDGEQRLVVVAATSSVVDGNDAFPIPTASAIDVLAARDGTRHFRIPILPHYAWTASISTETPDRIPAIVVPSGTLAAYSALDGSQLWSFSPSVPATGPMLHPVYFSNAGVTPEGNVAVQYFVNVGVDAASQRIRPLAGNPDHHVRALIDGDTGLPMWQAPIPSPGAVKLVRGVTLGTTTAEGTPGVAFTHDLGQHPSFNTQVDVHDLADGSLSYSARMSKGSYMGNVAHPSLGLVSFNRFNDLTTISPDGPVERRLGWPAGHDLIPVHTARFGDVFVTANEGWGWIGVFDPVPSENGYRRITDWVSGVIGGRLLARDLDGDGSDEVIHFSYDNNAYTAVTNHMGLFSIGGDNNLTTNGIDIYSFDCPPGSSGCSGPQLEDTQVSFTGTSATSGQYTDEATVGARLVDSDGNALTDAPLTFTLTGSDWTLAVPATTDADGVATAAVDLAGRPGAYDLGVSFAGDPDYAPAGTTRSFTIEKEDGGVTVSVEGKGANKRVVAHLFDLDSTGDGIADRTIGFSADGEPIGAAQTDRNGVASETVPPRYRGAGHTFEANFAGDEYFLPATASSDGSP